MPAPRLPELGSFMGPGEVMWLSGEPASVLSGADEYLTFAHNCDEAASLIRSVEAGSSEFVGPEADAFREKL